MDFIRQRDWCATRHHRDAFVDEEDIDNCVIERILRNKFWDPLISDEEDEPVGVIDWNSVFKKKNSKEQHFRIFVPGFRVPPPHPKISALTRDEQRQCVKVLSAIHNSILPREFLGRPSKADHTVFENKKEIYANEQKEYIEWAKNLWISTNCIRALRPKPIIEMIYEAEYKMKEHVMQSFPNTYSLAAQIPLTSSNHKCEIILPKTDLVKVDMATLPEAVFPDIYDRKEIILKPYALPEPCTQHPCKFKLPNESVESLLPLTEIHKELAQYAVENNAGCIASENAIKCLLETDRSWSLALSVCEVISLDGENSNVVVLGKEFPIMKDPAPMRSYRAYKHLLQRAFTKNPSRIRRVTDCSDISISSTHSMNLRSKNNNSDTPKNANKLPARNNKAGPTESHNAGYTNTLRKIINRLEASDDSDDEDRLEIDVGDVDNPIDETQKSELFQFTAVATADDSVKATNKTDEEIPNSSDHELSPPRKILKAHPRSSPIIDSHNAIQDGQTVNSHERIDNSTKQIDSQDAQNVNRHCQNVNQDGQNDNQDGQNVIQDGQNLNQDCTNDNQDETIEIGLFNCVCKDTEFEVPAQRSFRKWQIKNCTTREQVNIIIHCTHKLKNHRKNEVILEPIVEYQLDIGGTEVSTQKMQSLAFSLMLRKNADLVNVRLDGVSGELVTLDIMNHKELTAIHGDFRPHTANTLYTALNQLAGLLPGQYVLRHEVSHGSNGLLYSTRAGAGSDALAVTWGAAVPAGEEARLVQAPPRLRPVLLPCHKYRRQLPLAFTYDPHHVAKESTKPVMRKKPPPAALQWPKKKKGRKSKKT